MRGVREMRAVVAPSLHPEGRHYFWVDPDGTSNGAIPHVDQRPELPAAWLDHLNTTSHTSHQRRHISTGTETAPAVARAYGERLEDVIVKE